jgi:hypothetical protein
MNQMVFSEGKGREYEYVSPVPDENPAEQGCGPAFAEQSEGATSGEFLHSDAD